MIWKFEGNLLYFHAYAFHNSANQAKSRVYIVPEVQVLLVISHLDFAPTYYDIMFYLIRDDFTVTWKDSIMQYAGPNRKQHLKVKEAGITWTRMQAMQPR